MRQRFLMAAVLMAACCLCNPLWAQRSQLITEAAAARHGLVRPWFTQVELDQTHSRLTDLVLYEGTLYAQTDNAVIHAIDAETGRTLWSKQVGRPEHPSVTPCASHDLLATCNGSRLYVVNRFNGDILLEREIDGAPGAGPAMSGKHVYVPTTQGMLLAYRLEPPVDAKAEAVKSPTESESAETPQSSEGRHQNIRLRQETIPPLAFQTAGHAIVQPLVTHETAEDEYVLWSTDIGYMNISYINRQEEKAIMLKHRLVTESPIVGRPAFLLPDPKIAGDPGVVFAVTGDGFAYAIEERSGQPLWKYSTGEPIAEPPALIDDHLYVPTMLGGMYCLNAKTGDPIWRTPGIARFVAASQARVYTLDKLGRIVVLNAQDGTRLDTLPTEQFPIKLFNIDTDRIFLADTTGLIQCLHEVELGQPLVHFKDRKLAAVEAEKPTKKERGAAGQGESKKDASGAQDSKSKKGGKKTAEPAGG